ncbi:L-ornithine 5-monooxygenase [Dipodascopsis uninucleata]
MISKEQEYASSRSSSPLSATSVSSLATNPGSVDDDGSELYDLILVGFGPAALAIAIALREKEESLDEGLRVLALEKQDSFAWHSGMLLPDSRMQISFLKDFATLRSPRSEFTFLNYLYSSGGTDRLLGFINESSFYPLREEYNSYMSWCADKFNDWVRYSEQAISIAASPLADGSTIHDTLTITSLNTKSGALSSYKTKNVVVCVGGKPVIPPCLKTVAAQNPRVIHSSQFLSSVDKLKEGCRRIAVIGAGQSAAEITEYLHGATDAEVDIIFSQRALRPSDDSPFVNEYVFNPESIDVMYSLPSDLRQAELDHNRQTNYSVVRLEILEKLHTTMYAEKLPSRRRRLGMRSNRRVVGAEVQRGTDDREGVLLILQDTLTGAKETVEYDAVVAATGYDHIAPCVNLLTSLEPLLVGDVKSNASGILTVDRSYRVQVDEKQISAHLWLQGSCEATHGLGDTLLSNLSIRGEEVADQIINQVC